MANFNPNHKIVLDNLLLSHPLVRAGKMFGFPAYYVGKKLCICLYEDGVGIKLPASSGRQAARKRPKRHPLPAAGQAQNARVGAITTPQPTATPPGDTPAA
jgi:hypothetical protein